MIAVRKCLVVGSGSIACRHIGILRHLLPTAEVACVSASGRPLSADETTATHRLASLSDAIAWRPDLAVIASPAPFHPVHAAAFLDVGAAVLIEKPLADSCARFDELAARFSAHRDRIEVAYNLRYLPALFELKKQIDREVIGHLHSIRIEVGHYLPDWRPHIDYRRNVSANKVLGGGVLLELSHELDYLLWIFGNFDTAYCIASNSGQLEVDVEDRVDIMLSRADGVVAQLHMDFLQRQVTRQCKVVGETGTLHLDLATNSLRVFRPGNEEILFSEPRDDRNLMYIEQMRGFIELATGQRAPRITLDEGIAVLTLIDSLRQSASTGLPVALQPE
jgi:predicted dehydrogenase